MSRRLLGLSFAGWQTELDGHLSSHIRWDPSAKRGQSAPDIKVPGANMGPIWGRQDPGGPHVGPINVAFWGSIIGTF